MESSLARAKGIQRGQRSMYEKSRYTGVTRETVSNGIMRDKTTQVNDLVAVGHYTIIEDLRIYDNPVSVVEGHMPIDCVTTCKGQKTRTVYHPYRECCDAFGKPFIYLVKGYTKGIENALDEFNEVILEGVYSSGISFEKRLRTIYLATGSQRMFEVDPSEVKNYED